MTVSTDKNFSGSIPHLYETHLVPLLFEPYAKDLAARVKSRAPARVLEIAAGTGVVTRRMAAALPGASIVATDLNQAMVDEAAAVGAGKSVEWRQADALQLPFSDGSFDVVVCQFGVMFFPDKPKAFSEARRVLAPGGAFVFSVWDSLADNEIADIVTSAMAALYPSDPPRFLPRTPYGYFDRAVIARELAAAGFSTPPRIETVAARSVAPSANGPAIGFVQGTPLRAEIEARGSSTLDEATKVAAEQVANRFGSGSVDARMQALVVTVEA